MSKRKVQFDEVEREISSASAGSRRFKEKHSLDSDEEYDEKVEKLDEEDIEGQEDCSVDIDDGIKITPFNMKEEMEEGHFDKDGMYIFSKDKNEIRDEWMDNIDWQIIKEKSGKEMQQDDESDTELEKVDLMSIYKQMLVHMKPGETVAKALRRLGGNKGKHLSSSQRWKAKKQKQETEDNEAAKSKEDFLELTGLADKVLSDGIMEVYEMTYEKLNYELQKFNKGSERLEIPEGTDANDILDMFADNFDSKESDKIKQDYEAADGTAHVSKEQTQNKLADAEEEKTTSDEVKWEYKWEDTDEAEVHGPYTSSEMLKQSEDGSFKTGVYCRKVGTQSQFYTSTRIDFDLYI